MPRLTVPVLNLPTVANQLLTACEAGTIDADKCAADIEAEIHRQGKLYSKSHRDATTLFTNLHAATQGSYRVCEQLVKSAGDLTVDGEADKLLKTLTQQVDVCTTAIDDFKETKQQMTNQQELRGSFCQIPLAKAQLGAAKYAELDKIYHGYRDQPLEGYMRTAPLLDRMQEHIGRIADLIREVQFRAKEASNNRNAIMLKAETEEALNTDLLKEIRTTIQECVERGKTYETEIKPKTKDLKDKRVTKAAVVEWVKQSNTVLDKQQIELKTAASKIKSCHLRCDKVITLAKEFPHDKPLAALAKTIRKDVEATEKLHAAAVKKIEANRKAIVKFGGDVAKIKD